MSFLSKIGHAFGFGNDSFEDDADVVGTNEGTQTEQTEIAPDVADEIHELPTIPVIDPEMKEQIFDGVIKVFNSALPDFLSRSVDPSTQRRLLVESLDKSTNEYLNNLMLKAEQYAEAKLKIAIDSSLREAEKLKNEIAHIEQQRQSLQESQLSSDRRRRALDDKVRDLESKVETLEAEREQYQLENKSLLNKLKVSEIQPGVMDDMTREIERLKKALEETGCAPAEPQIIEDTTKIEALNKTVADMQEQLRMTEAMYNDMQEKFAEERSRRLETENKLKEAQSVADEFAGFQEQLDKVEEVIRARDERIEKLSASNRRLRNDNEALRKSLEEIEASKQQIALEDTEEAVPEAVITEMNAIEDDFECPDWFVAEPGPGNTPLHTEDPNFGYQEPPRKPHKPESDAQLSLF